MPERAGQAVAQQQAKQRHPGLKQTEHHSDAQPGPGIDAADADRDGRGEVGQAQGRCDQQEREHRHHRTKPGPVTARACWRWLTSRAASRQTHSQVRLVARVGWMRFPHPHGAPLRRTQTKGSAVMAEPAIYRYVPHRRTQARLSGQVPSPVKVIDQLPAGTRPARFNAWLAVKVTTGSAPCGAPTPSPRSPWSACRPRQDPGTPRGPGQGPRRPHRQSTRPAWLTNRLASPERPVSEDDPLTVL